MDTTSINQIQPAASAQNSDEATQLWQWLQGFVNTNQNNVPGLRNWFYQIMHSPQPSTLDGVKTMIQNVLNGRGSDDNDFYMALNSALYNDGLGVVPNSTNDATSVLSKITAELQNIAQSNGDSWSIETPKETAADQEFENLANWTAHFPSDSDMNGLGNNFLRYLSWNGSDVDVQNCMNSWAAKYSSAFADHSVPLATMNQFFNDIGYTPPSFFNSYYSLAQLMNSGSLSTEGNNFAYQIFQTLSNNFSPNSTLNPETLFENMIFTNPPSTFFSNYPGIDYASLQSLASTVGFSDPNSINAYLQLGNYLPTLPKNSVDYTTVNVILGQFTTALGFTYPHQMPDGTTVNSPLQYIQKVLNLAVMGINLSPATVALFKQLQSLN